MGWEERTFVAAPRSFLQPARVDTLSAAPCARTSTQTAATAKGHKLRNETLQEAKSKSQMGLYPGDKIFPFLYPRRNVCSY